ncbi:hypothetical protein [Anaerotignum faecicola]
MFTLEQVNHEVDLFVKETQMSIPPLTNIIHIDSHKSFACVSSSDIASGKYIIYISNDLCQYDLDYQISVLWHEFVHVHDILYFKNIKNIKYIMATCSEAFATTTQLEYLCRKSNTKHILYEGQLTTVSAVAQSYFRTSVQYCKDVLSTSNPKSFYNAIRNFSYCCGAILLCWEDPLKFLKENIDDYPEVFQHDLLQIGDAIFSKNPIRAGNLYEKLHRAQQKQALERIANRNK